MTRDRITLRLSKRVCESADDKILGRFDMRTTAFAVLTGLFVIAIGAVHAADNKDRSQIAEDRQRGRSGQHCSGREDPPVSVAANVRRIVQTVLVMDASAQGLQDQ